MSTIKSRYSNVKPDSCDWYYAAIFEDKIVTIEFD